MASTMSLNKPTIGENNSCISTVFRKENTSKKDMIVGYVPYFVSNEWVYGMSDYIIDCLAKNMDKNRFRFGSITINIPFRISFPLDNPSKISEVRVSRRRYNIYDMIKFDDFVIINNCIFYFGNNGKYFVAGILKKISFDISDIMSISSSNIVTEDVFALTSPIKKNLLKNKFFNEFMGSFSLKGYKRELIDSTILKFSYGNIIDISKNIMNVPYVISSVDCNECVLYKAKSEEEIINAYKMLPVIDKYLYNSSKKRKTVLDNGKKVFYRMFNKTFNDKDHIISSIEKTSRHFLESEMIITDFE